MIALPRHLAPWASALEIFPEEIALALGGLVARLSSLIGGAHRASAPEGEPDGYDGIARRGSYERLLVSEWAILEEMPDEFVRRVAFGEHSFLHRAHKGDRGGRRSVVLFDTGADQLGAPRLLHVAILILLARRAEARGAALAWGILQDETGLLHEGVSQAGVAELLRGRRHRAVSRDDIARWATVTGSTPTSEVWLVGADALADDAPPPGTTLVTIAEVLEPAPPQRMHVRVTSSLERPREAWLDVPAERVAVQILRDPFASAVAPRTGVGTALDARAPLLFASDGRTLYVRSAESTLISFPVPNSPRASMGNPVVFNAPSGQEIVAIGRIPHARRAALLTSHGSDAYLHILSKRGASSVRAERLDPGDDSVTLARDPHRLLPLGALAEDRSCFVDARGALFDLSDGRIRRVSPQPTDVVATTPIHGGLGMASRTDAGTVRVDVIQAHPNKVTVTPTGSFVHLPPILDGGPFHFGAGVWELFAYPIARDRWIVAHAINQVPEHFEVDVPGDLTVVGVMKHAYPPVGVGLVTLDATRTRIGFVPADPPGASDKTLMTTVSPVVHAAFCTTGELVAFLTEVGEVVVYSSAHDAAVMRASIEVRS